MLNKNAVLQCPHLINTPDGRRWCHGWQRFVEGKPKPGTHDEAAGWDAAFTASQN
ncbi:MAG: hypothetical protein KAJ19_03865 [Gammaproteobacteria bacterium]|nr:hypothetical protein [Gammaproteobacteria bacterium]